MFSGIIETKGTIQNFAGGHLVLDTPWSDPLIGVGQSIAVDGCCLTVVDVKNQRVSFDVSPETIERTTLAFKKPGDSVNLERGLKWGGTIDGHLVTGHVDGIGVVQSIDKQQPNGNWVVTVTIPLQARMWIAQKGSVSIDGVSLTINEVSDSSFSFTLIPHTVQVTTFQNLRTGSRVNLEFDLIAKYVERVLGTREKVSEMSV